MATSTDPRAAGFDATAFRDAIKFAMNMGLPEDETERATFRWKTQKTFAIADSGGRPFALNSDPETVEEIDDVLPPVAVDFSAVRSAEGAAPFGDIENPTVVITLLDEEYALIIEPRLADQVILGGNTYNIDYVAPPYGLFGVTVYDIYASAVDEN